VAYVDSDGVVDEPLEIRLDITRVDDRLRFDFAGSSPPCRGPMNSVLATTLSSVYLAMRHIFPEVPISAGAFEPLDITGYEGTFLDARYPRPVSGCAAEVSQRIAEAVFAAMVQPLPDRVTAAPAGTSGNFALGGHNAERGRDFVMYQLSGGGYGGNADGDGLSNGCSTIGISKAPPVEIMEQAFPVLVFSHGFGGFRQTSTFHLSHVASWGFVAITPDHLERGIAAQATGTLGGGAENQDVLDVLNSLDALAAHPELGPVSDLDRVAITGHSAGGSTSGRAAAEDAIDAYITIAAGTPQTVIQKPAMVFIAENDETVAPERSYGLFDQLEDALLVNIANAGHNSFTDSCAGIYDLGGLGMLEALLGAEQVARAEDGCKEPAIRPELAYDVLNHYTVQFLTAQFIDPAAAGPIVDLSETITPLIDFQVTGDPLTAS